MDLLLFVLLILLLFGTLAIRVRQNRSVTSYLSDRLLRLLTRQSLIPINRTLEQYESINAQQYMPPLVLNKILSLDETTDEGMQVLHMGDHRCDTLIFFLHGGVYVEQPTLAHWIFLERIRRLSNCQILIPIYPKAPNHTVEAVLPAVRRLFEKQTAQRVVLMGDSAGGGLALALAQCLGRRKPDQLILLSPWLDIALTEPGIPFLQPLDPMLDAQRLRMLGDAWRGVVATDDPWVSPIYGRVITECPTALFVGTHELFLADARKLRRIYREAGIELEYHEGKRLNHDYPLFPIPEARRAQKRICELVYGLENPASSTRRASYRAVSRGMLK